MARFAIVAPVNILLHLQDNKQLGNTHLLLAHDVAANPADYYRIFHPTPQSHELPPQEFSKRLIIMDNSVIEQGGAVSLDLIASACGAVSPTCVVLPDVLGDGKATAEASRNALEPWTDRLLTNDNWWMSFMYVPQGKTFEEFVKCAEVLADVPRIKFWGVPRHLVEHLGTRLEAIKILKVINPDRAIHMLGFSNDMVDDVLCARQPEVGSIDSAVPLRLRHPIKLSTKVPPRGDWWENAEYDPVILHNISKVRRWIHA